MRQSRRGFVTRGRKKLLVASIVVLLLGLPSLFAAQPTGLANALSSGAVTYRTPFQVSLGNVSTSFNSLVYVPIYLVNGSSFRGLSQEFSFDSSLLAFKGVVNDVSSQNVAFASELMATDVLQVNGTGNFLVPSHRTTLYYLEFKPLQTSQIITEVLLDATTIGSTTTYVQSVSSVVLAYGWRGLGPADIGSMQQAGTVPAVGFSPSYSNILYVASGRSEPNGLTSMRSVYGFGGLYRSNDSGATWYPVDLGLNSTGVNAIAVLPQNPNVVVISTGSPSTVAGVAGGGVYKSVNGGKTWQETFGDGGSGLLYYQGSLYAASYHAVLVSTDFGTTWHVMMSTPYVVTSVDAQSGGKEILVGVERGGTAQILRSINGGRSFSIAGDFPGYYSVSQILTDPSNQTQLWALIDHGYTTYPNLFRSWDSGASWQPVNDTKVGITFSVVYDPYGGNVAEAPQGMTIDPANGSIIYVVGPSSSYESTDGGSSFTPIAGAGDDRMVTVDPANDSVVFIGSDQGLYVSHDGGRTLSPLDNRSSNLVYSAIGQGSNLVTVEQDFGPISSNNFGNSWVSGPQGGEGGWAAVDPYNSSVSIVDSAHVDIEVSQDGGRSFFAPAISNKTGFVMQQYLTNAPQIAFGNRAIYIAQQGGIYVSKDLGSTWSLIQGSPTDCISIALDPIHQNILYASSCVSGIFTSPRAPDYGGGLFVSTDSGTTWSSVNSNSFTSLVVDPANDSIIAGIEYPPPSTTARILLSTDSGKTFVDLGFPSVDGFVAAPLVSFHESNGTAYIVYTTDEGVFVSKNLGKTWQDWSYNMPAPVISSLQVNSNGSAFASTYGTGVWFDPQLFNATFRTSIPLLTGYLPTNSALYVNGSAAVQHEGAFSLPVQPGATSLRIVRNGTPSTGLLNTVDGSVYYLDFASNVTTLTVTPQGLGSGNMFGFSVGGDSYMLRGGVPITLTVRQSVLHYSVGAASTDYSLLVPSDGSGTINATFLPASLSLNFVSEVKNGFANLTGVISGFPTAPFWTESLTHNKGYEFIGGGGGFGLLNLNKSTFTKGPAMACCQNIESSIPYENGFLLGGRNSEGGVLYYYDITSGELKNLTSILPAHLLNSYFGSVTRLDLTSNGSAVVMGSGQGVYYVGLLDGFNLRNLTQFVPTEFIGSPGYSDSFGAYVTKYNAEVIAANPKQLGVLFLGNATFKDFSSSVPLDALSLAHDSASSNPTWQGMSSNGSVVFIGGMNAITGGGFEALFSPTSGFTDITNLFPSDMILLTASWNGRAFIVSGANQSGGTPSVYAFNPTTGTVTTISSNDLKGFQLVDAIDSLSDAVSVVAGFEITAPPGANYVIYSSKYAALHLNATGVAGGTVSPPTASVTIDGTPVPVIGGLWYAPEFSGSYSLVVAAPGYETSSQRLTLSPFTNIQVNITLAPMATTSSTKSASSSTSGASSTTSSASASVSSSATSATVSTSATSPRGGVPTFPLQPVAVGVLASVIVASYVLARWRSGRRSNLAKRMSASLPTSSRTRENLT